MTPWDQRAARVLVRPLAGTFVTANQLTVLSTLIALAGAALLATGDGSDAAWGAGLFVLARFMDHFDGELARLTGTSSRVGYYLDYFGGAISYAALFAGIGIGLSHGALGNAALVPGLLAALCAVVAMVLNLSIDEASPDGEAVGYPGFAGFELEDGIYLLAPITWLGWLEPFFIAATIGACVYTLWTLACMLRARAARSRS